jgi:hypothetical protein
MYKLDLPIDIKEKAAIERRRRAEKERQGRIFNSRNRQIGVMEYQISISLYFLHRLIKSHLINKFSTENGWKN